MIYPLEPVPLYVGELEPAPPVLEHVCARCEATFRTARSSVVCALCVNHWPSSGRT